MPSNLKKYWGITILCTLGLLIRVAFADSFVHWDSLGFKLQAKTLSTASYKDMWVNYPGPYEPYLPLHYYLLEPANFLFSVFDFNEKTDGYLPNLIIKLPIFLAEIGAAFVIWKVLSKNYSEKISLIGSALFLFHPVVLFVSIIVGQVDAIIIFFLLTSLYFLEDRRLAWSAFFASLGIVIKPIALCLLPLIALASLANNPFRKLILPLSIAIVLILAAFFPFTIGEGYYWGYQFVKKMADRYLFSSVYALNLWAYEGFMLSDMREFMGITLKKWGLFMVYTILGILFTTVLLKKVKIKGEVLFLLALLSFYTTYLFATRMVYGRFLIFVFAFYPLLIFINKKIFVSFILSSFVVLLNLIYVTGEYNLPFSEFVEGNKAIINALITANFAAYFLLVYTLFKNYIFSGKRA